MRMFLDSYDSYDCCVLNLMATSVDIPWFIQTTRFWIEIGQQLLAWISTANSNAAAAVQGEMWIFSKPAGYGSLRRSVFLKVLQEMFGVRFKNG